MDIWKFFDITHKEHIICNPTSLPRYQRLISLLRLKTGARVVEIATGKGEFMIQLAERYNVSGVAVDISPYCIADATAKLRERVPDADVTFIEMDGAKYKPEHPEAFDLAACIGASWIFGGHKGTLEALAGMIKPGGQILVGEPYWLKEPDPQYLSAAGFERNTFGTHYENVRTGELLGLNLNYSMVSTHDEWDNYEALQWYASNNYAMSHPDDPDLPELLQRVSASKEEYLRWGRDTVGWAIYMFTKN